MKANPKFIVRVAVIAAIYVALCVILQPISYGIIQVRVAEALTLLPIIFPESILGLAIGVIISNLIGPFGFIDILFGSLATVIAAILTFKTKKTKIAWVWPILLNAVIVGSYLPFTAGLEWSIPLSMLAVGVGEAVAVIFLGIPLVSFLKSKFKYD